MVHTSSAPPRKSYKNGLQNLKTQFGGVSSRLYAWHQQVAGVKLVLKFAQNLAGIPHASFRDANLARKVNQRRNFTVTDEFFCAIILLDVSFA